MCVCVCVPDFSNVISKSEIKALAEADEQEVVAEVQVRVQSGAFRPNADLSGVTAAPRCWSQ